MRQVTNRALIAVLWLHVPIAMTIAMARGMDWMLPTLLNAALAAAATLSWRVAGNGLSTCLVVAVALMGGVSVFTFELSGHPWQIDIHMYFFAALACLVAYCDFRPIVAGTLAVALHHLVLNFIIPAAVFPGGADFGRVILHAVILVLEASVLVWVAHQLAHMFVTQRTAETEAANAALARANADRIEAEHRAKLERDTSKLGLASEFERSIGHIVEAVGIAATNLLSVSSLISHGSAESARQAAEAATASTQASHNVETVASAVEELTVSISGIAHQALRSAQVASQAAEDAQRTNSVVEGLATGTQKIGEVVTLIQNIASQTNLLALNATIEAARAGDHGRGFAVVAGEVKALANQTAKATEEISNQIQGIQSVTDETVAAIQAIGRTIAEINEISGAIAAAVKQQGEATSAISLNVQQAANGTSEVNSNIVGLARTSSDAGVAASKLLEAANGLSSQSEQLKAEVKSFLGSVRAA
ncbi:MAG TPA: methyl-accepting chemotaxis protein [Bradyrhizobium sp.]|nr:methyl-accepting chemotaxis protein [Bradyrhizobium sp.]